MKPKKIIFNSVELALMICCIYAIYTEYTGKYSSYRFSVPHESWPAIRIALDIAVVAILLTRIFQTITRTTDTPNREVSRRFLLLVAVLYPVLLSADLYAYTLWSYYTSSIPAILRLLVFIAPLTFWIYRYQRKGS